MNRAVDRPTGTLLTILTLDRKYLSFSSFFLFFFFFYSYIFIRDCPFVGRSGEGSLSDGRTGRHIDITALPGRGRGPDVPPAASARRTRASGFRRRAKRRDRRLGIYPRNDRSYRRDCSPIVPSRFIRFYVSAD